MDIIEITAIDQDEKMTVQKLITGVGLSLLVIVINIV